MFENSLKNFESTPGSCLPRLFYDYVIALVDLKEEEKTSKLIESLSLSPNHLIFKLFQQFNEIYLDFST